MNKILVVEDEKEVRNTIIDLLENSGYTTISAQDGRQAIKILEYEIPDLVISDIMMPEVDGYRLLEHFQKLPGTTSVPFIFLTAKTESTNLRKGMTLGADDYLMKPFRAKELLQSVETQLKKKERIDKKFEDIFLDISAYVPHEFRTPLISIIGYADLITEGKNEFKIDEISEMAKKIKLSSNRLHKTIEKFIRYSGIRLRLASKGNGEPNNVFTQSPNIILEYTIKRMMKEAQRENDLEWELIDSPIKISENDFGYLVEEIVENALKFSEPGSKIIIKSSVDEDEYKLNITDHGRGMAKEQIANIITLGQQDKNKYQKNPNGLGLISVKNLMTLYCGIFNLSSEINEYTTCSLSLPVYKSI
jgi:CheY-like chemotaxis protein